jgi:hypothetical protein
LNSGYALPYKGSWRSAPAPFSGLGLGFGVGLSGFQVFMFELLGFSSYSSRFSSLAIFIPLRANPRPFHLSTQLPHISTTPCPSIAFFADM